MIVRIFMGFVLLDIGWFSFPQAHTESGAIIWRNVRRADPNQRVGQIIFGYWMKSERS